MLGERRKEVHYIYTVHQFFQILYTDIKIQTLKQILVKFNKPETR